MLDTSLRFIIRSDLAESHRVQKRILEEVERHHYCDAATFAIRIALEEALSNAIKHGNQLKRGKKVRVEASITPEQTEIIVEDEGCGFDRAGVPDPTTDDNLQRLHGRGILLIESYMHVVEWCCGGRRVRMVRRNDAEEPRR